MTPFNQSPRLTLRIVFDGIVAAIVVVLGIVAVSVVG